VKYKTSCVFWCICERNIKQFRVSVSVCERKVKILILRTFKWSYMWFFTNTDTMHVNQLYRVDPWKLSFPFDRSVFSDVWSEFESFCNGFVSASASASDNAEMLSAVILSAVAKIQRLQQYASEGGLRKQDRCKRSSAQTVTSIDNQRQVPYIEGHHDCRQRTVSHGQLSFLYFVRIGETEAH
jgi:hypothetical protein